MKRGGIMAKEGSQNKLGELNGLGGMQKKDRKSQD
jgi:hypothetical protein